MLIKTAIYQNYGIEMWVAVAERKDASGCVFRAVGQAFSKNGAIAIAVGKTYKLDKKG